MKLRAYGNHVVVKRDETETQIGSFAIPDSALIKPNKGTILSVGWLVRKTDETIKPNQTCYWNKHVGWEFELEDDTVTVLTADQLLFSDEAKKEQHSGKS